MFRAPKLSKHQRNKVALQLYDIVARVTRLYSDGQLAFSTASTVVIALDLGTDRNLPGSTGIAIRELYVVSLLVQLRVVTGVHCVWPGINTTFYHLFLLDERHIVRPPVQHVRTYTFPQVTKCTPEGRRFLPVYREGGQRDTKYIPGT